MILLRKIRCFLFGHIAELKTHPLLGRDSSLKQLMCPRCMVTFDYMDVCGIDVGEWVLRTLPKRTRRKI